MDFETILYNDSEEMQCLDSSPNTLSGLREIIRTNLGRDENLKSFMFKEKGGLFLVSEDFSRGYAFFKTSPIGINLMDLVSFVYDVNGRNVVDAFFSNEVCGFYWEDIYLNNKVN